MADFPANVPEFACLCNLLLFRTPVFRVREQEFPTERSCRGQVPAFREDRGLTWQVTHIPKEVSRHIHPSSGTCSGTESFSDSEITGVYATAESFSAGSAGAPSGFGNSSG